MDLNSHLLDDAFGPDFDRDHDAPRDYATVVDPDFDEEDDNLVRSVAAFLGYGGVVG